MGHQAKKRFGQNFLCDQGIIDRIVRAIGPKEGERLIEIGPGQGALTEHFLKFPINLSAIELDRDLVTLLKQRFGSQLHLHQGDALKWDFSIHGDATKPFRVVGNLPYNISTPLLFHLLEFSSAIHDMTFMLQKEVVTRIIAKPGDSNYSRLSVMLGSYCRFEKVLDVPPSAFTPQPKVDSSVIRMIPYPQGESPYEILDFSIFANVVRSAFQMRRKTLNNNLKNMISKEELAQLGIDPQLRPQQLSISQFVDISNFLTK